MTFDSFDKEYWKLYKDTDLYNPVLKNVLLVLWTGDVFKTLRVLGYFNKNNFYR